MTSFLETHPDLCCPVTLTLMNEPVTTRCGHNFEKATIMQVLTSNGTPQCPTCRTPLERTMPTVNYALKTIIERLRSSSGSDSDSGASVTETPAAITANPNRPSVLARKVAGTNKVHFQVSTGGDLDTAVPVDFYFLNDRSGSMGERAAKATATTTASADTADANEFARHQLTDFAVNVCNIMGEKNRAGLVVFDTDADVVCGPRKMDDAGKAFIKQKLPLPPPRGGTDFWVGILKTLDLAKANYRPGALTVIFLLTDGATDSSRIPAGGFNAAIEDWKEDNPTIKFMINTIGFGYGPSVDMRTLAEIAHSTGGTVSYIPDGGFVCPVFTHLVANLMTCQHVDLNLRLEPESGIRLSKVNFPVKMLQSGQTRDFYVDMTGSKEGTLFKATIADETFTFADIPTEECNGQYLRDHLVDVLERAVDRRALNVQDINQLYAGLSEDTLVKAIKDDVQHADPHKGQISKAFIPGNWANWGYHYILSILDGLHLQIRVNDKDAIGLTYALGSCTEALIKKGTRLLRTITLPEGKYSANQRHVTSVYVSGSGSGSASGYASGGIPPPAPAVRGRTLADGGGCFIGSGLVKMADSSLKRVDELRKGDLVYGGHRIRCVVLTLTDTGRTEIVRLGHDESAGWTPNHPVRYNDTWYLPGDIKPERLEDCITVFNFVLDTGHIMIIGDVETCTLAHDFTGDVIEHPFYGKRRAGAPHIMDILEADTGYQDGLVVLSNKPVKRDELGYVCGF